MPLTRFIIFLALLFVATANAQPSQPPQPFTQFKVILLQPSSMLEERVRDVGAMAAYVKAVEVASREAVVASGARQAVGGFIVVAVRPGSRSNVWLDFDALVDLELKKQLVASIRAVAPFEVVKGPVVFALKVATWNGKESKRLAPSPPEWKSAADAGARLEVGELVERIWSE